MMYKTLQIFTQRKNSINKVKFNVKGKDFKVITLQTTPDEKLWQIGIACAISFLKTLFLTYCPADIYGDSVIFVSADAFIFGKIGKKVRVITQNRMFACAYAKPDFRLRLRKTRCSIALIF